MMSYLQIIAVCLALGALMSTTGALAGDKEEKLKKIKDSIKETTEKAKDERGFVKELFSEVEKDKPEGYNVVVHNLRQEYETKLFDEILHEVVEKFGKRYGVWIFKCGKFENEGDHGPENWMFSKEQVYVIDKGEDAIFYDKDCSHYEYRERDQKRDD